MYQKPEKRIKSNKGQKELFLEIWQEREHVSELSGQYLGEEPNAWYFAHVLSKGAYPQLKLVKENIMLVTQEEHWQLDQNTHKAKENKLFQPFFKRADYLKNKYQ